MDPLDRIFGTMPDGSRVKPPEPIAPHALSEAIHHICRLADTMPGDSVVALSLLHAAALLVAELHVRMERYLVWIPPVRPPDVPTGHT